jgi:hypothetical protein
MSDSTDNARGPERIWALHNYVAGMTNILSGHIMLEPTEIAETTEYRRADLAPEAYAAELEKERDEWKSLAEAAIRDDASKNIHYAELQAKLAQAVDALDWIGNHMVMSMALDQGDLCMMMKQHARATLAELKGEDRG